LIGAADIYLNAIRAERAKLEQLLLKSEQELPDLRRKLIETRSTTRVIKVKAEIKDVKKESKPPTSTLDALGESAIISPAEPDALKLPPPHATSPAPSTDRPPEAYTDLNLPLKEFDANESDSSDEDSEDESCDFELL
jgi:hypothetical protein